MQLVKRELARLLDDHNRCPDHLIKKEIKKDIQLLKEAISIYEKQQQISFYEKEN
ncbi:hypothetical protein [Niallia taxi]|uniref:hypothetical protein n=1 Tax=Niallia taxi TaxID=2499688 RepID=UPI0021A2CFDF|nr:hypothetical protein [Niallia taxi]MCT2344277.1 hypothetical protein [Niallia taxi]MDE5053717.1 hypothetical protein [Niallia taxi]MED3964255.1 hypothetical protein [Niallia taxi]WOD63362.1 hypothetical protein NQZ71_03095 [Niallia taxi]